MGIELLVGISRSLHILLRNEMLLKVIFTMSTSGVVQINYILCTLYIKTRIIQKFLFFEYMLRKENSKKSV